MKRDLEATKILFNKVSRRDLGFDAPENGVLSEDQALKLFGQLKNMQDLRHDYVTDLCYAGAELMCLRMEKAGFEPSKAWSRADMPDNRKGVSENYPALLGTTLSVSAGGGMYVHWEYHVAPVLKVKVKSKGKNKVQYMVFDPALFDGPATQSEWAWAQNTTQQCISVYAYGEGPKGTQCGYCPSKENRFSQHPVTDAHSKIKAINESKKIAIKPRESSMRLRAERKLKKVLEYKNKTRKAAS